jgi:indolepyruvate ferredoxin oxidoreductase beta subunit
MRTPSAWPTSRRANALRAHSRRQSARGTALRLPTTRRISTIYGILPAAGAGHRAMGRSRHRATDAGQHVRTTTVVGFLRVWLLGCLRILRPRSLRAEREWGLIERWRAAVLAAAALDAALAVEVAETAGIVRGYGEVRRRLAGAFVRLLDEIVAPAVARDREAGAGFARSRGIVAEARRLLLTDEKGIEAAVALAAARV